jgi:putative membrane protein insertion efficiency factor
VKFMNPEIHPQETLTEPGYSSQAGLKPGGKPGAALNLKLHPTAISGAGDHEHEQTIEPRLRDLPLTITNVPRYILLGLIRSYQATFSRLLPADTCRFYPTCSHYGYQAIYKYGVLKGGLMAAWRVLRCNPFNPGGFDPVP